MMLVLNITPLRTSKYHTALIFKMKKWKVTLSLWRDEFNPFSNNLSALFAYILAREFNSKPLFQYSTPEPVTLSPLSESGICSIKSIPFYTPSRFSFQNADESSPHYPFHTFNASSYFFNAYLYTLFSFVFISGWFSHFRSL